MTYTISPPIEDAQAVTASAMVHPRIAQLSCILHDLWAVAPYKRMNTRLIKKVMFESTLVHSYTYAAYRQLIHDLLAAGKTTGPKQSEELTHYTGLNEKRMNRLDKTVKLTAELTTALEALDRPYIWLVLTEGWCGDAAQIVPVLQHIAEASDRLELRLVLRDEHPALMDRYLTDGARSIPKVIALEAEPLKEVGSWGPRPASAQAMLQAYKAMPEPRPSYMEFATTLHAWYAKDKTQETQAELTVFLKEMASKQVTV